jgi:hypothetical protein
MKIIKDKNGNEYEVDERDEIVIIDVDGTEKKGYFVGNHTFVMINKEEE